MHRKGNGTFILLIGRVGRVTVTLLSWAGVRGGSRYIIIKFKGRLGQVRTWPAAEMDSHPPEFDAVKKNVLFHNALMSLIFMFDQLYHVLIHI